jgi:hypothetical protein
MPKAAAKKTGSRAATKTTTKRAAAPSVAAQVDGFIDKFDPSVAKVIRSCRAAMRKRLPTANELVYDNYNFFVIGYGPTERPSHAIVSLACAKSGVGLAFLYGRSLPDPQGLLLGNGKQTGFIRLPSAKTLSEPAVEALLQAAVEHAKAPFATSGRGRTIVQSVSAAQRPRR